MDPEDIRQRVRTRLQEQRALVEELLRRREQLPGSLFVRYGVCGKEGCACRTGQKHGPYYVLSTRSGGQGGFSYLDEQQMAEARALVKAYREYRTGMRRLAQRERAARRAAAPLPGGDDATRAAGGWACRRTPRPKKVSYNASLQLVVKAKDQVMPPREETGRTEPGLRRKAWVLGTVIALIALVVGFVFGDRGILNLVEKRRQVDALRLEIEALRAENARLAAEIGDAAHEPARRSSGSRASSSASRGPTRRCS